MFNKISDDEILSRAEEIKKRRSCDHKNFTIYGHNIFAEATCIDCGHTDSVYIFLNSLINRLIKLEAELNRKKEDL